VRAPSRARKEKKSLSQSLVMSSLSTTARTKPPPQPIMSLAAGLWRGDQVIAGSAGDEVLLPFPEFGILEKVPARAAGHGVGAPPGPDEVASRPA
jgi:hypothetical protein